MAKRPDDMAQARWSDGINVIFDQKSPGSHQSRSRSRSSSTSTRSSRSSGSGYYRGRGNAGRYRSSSSSSSATSSSSTSSSRSRSRSHPRCRRRSSRCRCEDHYRNRSGHRYRSPRRRYRARSRSYSRSRTPESYSHHGRYYRSHSRSRSRSVGRWSRYRRQESQFRVRFSQSPYRSYRQRTRSRSRSRSRGSSVSLSLRDKRELLEAAKANAMKLLGVEKLELPESVKPILSEQSDSRGLSPEPTARVRQSSERRVSQDTETERRTPSPKMSPKGKITFSINNSVAKPTVAAPSSAKVTPRVDSYESRKPYGHWIPIGSGRTSSARKRT